MGFPGADRKEVILTSVIVAAALLFQAFFVVPKRRTVREMDKKIAALNSEIDNRLRTLREIEEMLDEGKVVEDFMIDAEEEILPKLLELLAELGKKHDLEIVSLKPRALSNTAQPAEGGSAEVVESKKLLIEMAVRARYRDLGGYFKDLESIPILVAVRKLRIKKEDPRDDLLVAEFLIETYSLKSNEKKD